MTAEITLTPSGLLRPWISEVSVHACEPGDQQPLVHLPDVATTLVFRTTAAGRSDLMVAGPRTRASYYVAKHLPVCIKLRVRPGAAKPLLGVPVSELVDRVVPLSDLWGCAADRLTVRLAGLGAGPELILEHLDAALLPRLTAQTSGDLARGDLLRSAVENLGAERPDRVHALARRLAVSERHLRDLFTDGVGLPPKRFARIARVRTVLTRPRHAGWAHLAATTGFYDQSHMTAEFRTLMGVPPGAFFAGRLPALQSC